MTGQQPDVPGRALEPPAPEPPAVSFEAEIPAAVSYEKGLAVKAAAAILLAVLVVLIRLFFLG